MDLNFVPIGLAFIVTFIMTPIVKKIAFALKVLDYPNTRKIHRESIPLLGGIGVYLGFLIGVFLSGFTPLLYREVLVILSAATLLLVVGILDEARFLHPQIKLMGAMPVAGIILIYFDLELKIFPFYLLNYFFTLFWIVGITAAYNLLDGLDGLSTGVCIIASLFYFITGLMANDAFLISISLALMGACLAFLIYNFHPAKIFLGDSGAIFLGFMLASMGLRVANQDSLPILTRWMLPIFILLVPIFDTSLITISRLRRGLIPFLHPGKDHSHHRLLNLGFGQRKTVLMIYLFALAGGLLSLGLSKLPAVLCYLIFAFLLIFLIGFISFFEKLPYERQELSNPNFHSTRFTS